MRIGKGYFWKSLGKRTTASHCSPSLPDLRPKQDNNDYCRYRCSFVARSFLYPPGRPPYSGTKQRSQPLGTEGLDGTAPHSAAAGRERAPTALTAAPAPLPRPATTSSPPGLTFVQLHEGGVGVQLLLAVARIGQEGLGAGSHTEPLTAAPAGLRGRAGGQAPAPSRPVSSCRSPPLPLPLLLLRLRPRARPSHHACADTLPPPQPRGGRTIAARLVRRRDAQTRARVCRHTGRGHSRRLPLGERPEGGCGPEALPLCAAQSEEEGAARRAPAAQ